MVPFVAPGVDPGVTLASDVSPFLRIGNPTASVPRLKMLYQGTASNSKGCRVAHDKPFEVAERLRDIDHDLIVI